MDPNTARALAIANHGGILVENKSKSWTLINTKTVMVTEASLDDRLRICALCGQPIANTLQICILRLGHTMHGPNNHLFHVLCAQEIGFDLISTTIDSLIDVQETELDEVFEDPRQEVLQLETKKEIAKPKPIHVPAPAKPPMIGRIHTATKECAGCTTEFVKECNLYRHMASCTVHPG